jgi:predicted nucleic acid-binding Zn ribbon protein
MPSPHSNSNPHSRGRGPRPLSEVLAELFAARGLGRIQSAKRLEDAWNAAVGEPNCRQTKVGEVRRGVLNVTVAHSSLLEELAAFQKPRILEALRQNMPDVQVLDIRFRVGLIEADEPPLSEKPPEPPRRKRPPPGRAK